MCFQTEVNVVVKNLVPRAETVKLPTRKKTRFGKTKVLCQVLRRRRSLLVRKLGVGKNNSNEITEEENVEDYSFDTFYFSELWTFRF